MSVGGFLPPHELAEALAAGQRLHTRTLNILARRLGVAAEEIDSY